MLDLHLIHDNLKIRRANFFDKLLLVYLLRDIRYCKLPTRKFVAEMMFSQSKLINFRHLPFSGKNAKERKVRLCKTKKESKTKLCATNLEDLSIIPKKTHPKMYLQVNSKLTFHVTSHRSC